MDEDRQTRKRRKVVAELYDGPNWKRKVARMPAHQITAIFLRIEEEARNPKPPPSLPVNESKPESDQLRLDFTGENSMAVEDPEFHESRPIPCPECGSTKGYSRVGKYRSQCLNCNALLKNAEVNREDQEPQ